MQEQLCYDSMAVSIKITVFSNLTGSSETSLCIEKQGVISQPAFRFFRLYIKCICDFWLYLDTASAALIVWSWLIFEE
jgi:hypothetical protein